MSEPIAKISFLPWLRQGLATRIGREDQLAPSGAAPYEPAGIDWSLRITARQVAAGSVAEEAVAVGRKLRLYGPEDILGIERRAVIKTEPLPGVQQFEPNLLPYIDFYEEDFPWRYTPFAAKGERLRPWIALVVLRGEEFEREPAGPGQPLPVFTAKGEPAELPFPPPYQLWAWAHVQVNTLLTGGALEENLRGLLERDPNLACSRLICPRRLEPDTGYTAFLIPAFENGRLAGLGAPAEAIAQTDPQLAAWGHPQDHFPGAGGFRGRFPIYYEWSFRTAAAGTDFETLARKISPRELHPDIGRRLIDLQEPGYGLPYTGGDYPNAGAVWMTGALQGLQEEAPRKPDEPTQAFATALAALINLEADLREKTALPEGHPFAQNPFFGDAAGAIYDDPIILPPLYGGRHAGITRVDANQWDRWPAQLNLDARHRLAAGFGAEVVRRNQEAYMERAWQQFGELFDLNAFLRRSQFLQEVNQQLYEKHLADLAPAVTLTVTAPAHHAIHSKTESLRSYLAPRVPKGMLSAGYDKVTRPGGTLMRRLRTAPDQLRQLQEIKVSNQTLAATIASEMAPPNGTPVTIIPKDRTHPLWVLFDASKRALQDPAAVPDWKKQLLEDNGVSDPVAFGQACGNLTAHFARDNWTWANHTSGLDAWNTSHYLKDKIEPRKAFPQRVRSRLSQTGASAAKEQPIGPIMRAPVFRDPTYAELIRIAPDDFVPNLDLVPPNTAGLMRPNRAFIEAFLAGLNHEMARELLWREFPTDQRGTCFSHFWDASGSEEEAAAGPPDIRPIHEWEATGALGSHRHPDAAGRPDPLVLVLRADLLRRYPHTHVYLQEAGAGSKLYPVFEARVEPDLLFLGFPVSKQQLLADPLRQFVIEERPGELHFGLDSAGQQDATGSRPANWDELNWSHLPQVVHHIDLDRDIPPPPSGTDGYHWGRGADAVAQDPASGSGSSADMACILYQNPVRITIPAKDLLPL